MGLLGSVGKVINDVTGATSASNAAYSQNRSLANLSFKHQKEFAQNQVQWYAQDLEKAGYNRALASGATSVGSGGSTGGSASAVTNGASILGDVINAVNTTKQTNADVDYKEDMGNAAIMNAIAAMKGAGVKEEELKGGAIVKALGKDAVSAFSKRVQQEKEGFQEMFKDGWKSFYKEMKRQAKNTFSK